MDRIREYREIVKRLLLDRKSLSKQTLPEGMDVTCLLDDDTSQYALLSIGWMDGVRISGNILMIRLKGDKIWVEEDGTDAPIANELLQAGVSRENIVLGFQPPEMRRFTDFAIA